MKTPYVFTPGPTEVKENVRLARAMKTTNPDLDEQFYDFYKETCEKIGKFLHTRNEVRILCGEGILGLEAACASLTEKGDRVLVLDNGIFGEGFADFVKIYGGEAVMYSTDRQKSIDIEELDKFLQNHSDFKYATIVHCDTPSGVLNDVSKICPLLKSKGIITVVDSVAAMGGEELRVDEWQIDIALGASQKCISAPPGLTFLSISEEAFKAMEYRKTSIVGYYSNLTLWKDYYKNKWFPYTMPISDIMALRVAMENIFEEKPENMIRRHKILGEATRKTLKEAGLELYIKKGYSNTVTVFELPEGIEEKAFKKFLLDKHNILISGSFGYLSGKVIRIGHMGENAKADRVSYILYAVQDCLSHFGFQVKKDMVSTFLNYLQ